MQHSRVSLVAAVLLFGPGARSAVAEEYWGYVYKDFEVITAAGRGRSVSAAHNLTRFDKALTRILELSESRLPTHIYELPPKEEKQLVGETGVASYRFDGYEVTVVTDAGASRDNPDWGALFGYTSSLLYNGRAPRSPYWYQVGVPQLFAHTEFDLKQVKTGGVVPGFAYTLQTSSLIPTRVLLRMEGSDPQLRSPDYRSVFEAQSWLLAHEIFLEGKLRPEFGHYLRLLRDGKPEADAFAESFRLTYEDLDKLLVRAMREPAHIFVVSAPLEAAEREQPWKLSAAEAKARLAYLNLHWQHYADALRLAGEALQTESGNELAVRVLARARAQEGEFSAALEAVDRLAALPALSPAALTDSGELLFRLAHEVFEKHASIGAEADALSGRAREAYERAISLDPQYLRAWAGLAYLTGSRRDRPGAQSLVTRAQPVMEKNLSSGALARALATMCAQTGLAQAAFLFGEYWREDALTPRDFDEATAFIARMKTQ